MTEKQYIGELFTNWCESSPYGEQVPRDWPELMAEFAEKHAHKGRDQMEELFCEGDVDEPFEKLLESIFATSCSFVIQSLREAVDSGEHEKLKLIGITEPK